MHAVVVKVNIQDVGTAENFLKEKIVPGVAAADGFVTAYWTRKDNSGMSMLVFESEETAKAMAETVASPDTDAVSVENVEVREVVAHA